MAFDQTSLRMNSRGRPLSTTEYIVPGASDSIGLDIGPANYWNEGALTTGTRATIGGKDGWLLRNDSVGIVFAFQCGTVDNVGLWCLVRAPADKVGRNAFDEFVRTIA